MKKHLYLMLDTETAGGFITPYVYDLGGAVIDRDGNVYESFSFVIKEIWHDHWELLKTAYFVEKLPDYFRQLLLDERQLIDIKNAKSYIESLCEQYNIKAIVAHNAKFDYNALNTTQKFLTEENDFLPFGIPIWDTLKMAQDVIATKKSYIKFCQENGYMTKHKKPRPQLKAEVLYRFITNDINFVESHTGLEDALIEKEIFAYCIKQRKAMRRNLFE